MPFFKKIWPPECLVSEKCRTFAAANAERPARRDGRVVDYSSLENCRAARHRGFESLSLRSQKPADFSGLFYFNLTLKSLKSQIFFIPKTSKNSKNYENHGCSYSQENSWGSRTCVLSVCSACIHL